MLNDVGIRLENFFWRIWGNKEICYNITGSTVAKLFIHISEGESLRTTPVPSPRASRATQVRNPVGYKDEALPLPALQQAGDEFEVTATASSTRQGKAAQKQTRAAVSEKAKSASKAEEDSTTSGSIQNAQPDVLSAVQFSLPSEQSSRTTADRPKVIVPQSILKRPREASVEEEPKGSQSDREEAVGSTARRPASTSEESTTSDISPSDQTPRAPTSPKQGQARKGGSRRKKASFALSGKERRRPSFARRKSSQSSGGATQYAKDTSPTAAPTSVSTSDAQGWVVDRDFRSKFVDHQQHQDHFDEFIRQPSAKTPSTVASTSTAAAGTLAFGGLPDPKDAKGKGKARVSVVDEEVPLKPAGPSSSSASAIDDADSPVSPASGLLRTKSQLTLLLERDRRRSEDISAGTAEPPKPRKTSG